MVMKLASYKDGSRDGQLVVVSGDLSSAHYASGIASRLQQALDDWNFFAPQLQDLSDALEQGKARHAFPFEPERCMAPLPRAFQWIDAVAEDSGPPMLCHGAIDGFLGPCDDVVVETEDWGVDFEPRLCVVTGDVPRGASPERALEAVRLVLLASVIQLRSLPATEECGVNAASLQGRLATGFGPVALTPSALGTAWREGRVHATVQALRGGRKLAIHEAAGAQLCDFGELIALAARVHGLAAGTVVGSGPLDGAAGGSTGKRSAEARGQGAAAAGDLGFGERLRIEARIRGGQAPWGAIEQMLVPPGGRRAHGPGTAEALA